LHFDNGANHCVLHHVFYRDFYRVFHNVFHDIFANVFVRSSNYTLGCFMDDGNRNDIMDDGKDDSNGNTLCVVLCLVQSPSSTICLR
jgi:hypothetical protein